VLLSYRIDRIVRPPEDGDEWDMPVLIRGLAKLGKELQVCNRGELKTDFASLLIAMLDACTAGEERRDTIERTTRGRNEKGMEGKVVGHELSTLGVKTPGEAKGMGPKHTAGVWRQPIVRLILMNEAYAGVCHCGKTICYHG
jgi:hypothetical protein